MGAGADVMKSEPGAPMTLGNAAAARVRLIVWYKACHQVEPDPAEIVLHKGGHFWPSPNRATRSRQSAPSMMKLYRGPPMTLGVAAAAGVRLIVWCKECHRQVEPDPAERARRYGAEVPVPEWQLCCENLPGEGRLRGGEPTIRGGLPDDAFA
jgi:hypothetical protein